MNDPRQVLINLIAGLSLADHMGDVREDAREALRQIGIEIPDDVGGVNEVADWLANSHGATSVWGVSLLCDDAA